LLLPVSWPSFNIQSFAVKKPISFWFVSFPPSLPQSTISVSIWSEQCRHWCSPKVSDSEFTVSGRQMMLRHWDENSIKSGQKQNWNFGFPFFEFGKIKN
jgi:hypothetical protein